VGYTDTLDILAGSGVVERRQAAPITGLTADGEYIFRLTDAQTSIDCQDLRITFEPSATGDIVRVYASLRNY
jgi:hypothetical protein